MYGRTSSTRPVTVTPARRPAASPPASARGRRSVSVDVGLLGANRGQDLAAEEDHRVFVRQPVHRAGEDQAVPGSLAAGRGREVLGVDAGRDDVQPAARWRRDTAARTSPDRRPTRPARRRSAPACAARSAASGGTARRRAAADRIGSCVSACRRQISDFDVVREHHRGAGQRASAGSPPETGSRRRPDRTGSSASRRASRAPVLRGAVLADGIRQRIEQVQRRVGVEAQASLWSARCAESFRRATRPRCMPSTSAAGCSGSGERRDR